MCGTGKSNGAAFVTRSVTTAVTGGFPMEAHFCCVFSHCMGMPGGARETKETLRKPQVCN